MVFKFLKNLFKKLQNFYLILKIFLKLPKFLKIYVSKYLWKNSKIFKRFSIFVISKNLLWKNKIFHFIFKIASKFLKILSKNYKIYIWFSKFFWNLQKFLKIRYKISLKKFQNFVSPKQIFRNYKFWKSLWNYGIFSNIFALEKENFSLHFQNGL